jgi:predicted phosphodiesterase
MRLVCISDTHNLHDRLQVPDGDVLIHAGDATRRGTEPELRAFDAWLATLPHRHKLLVAGNHDFGFQRDADARSWVPHARYLEDEDVVIEGVRFHGSPWQPWFHDWAFNLPRGPALRAVWDRIPADTDVLVTHSPPHGVLDRTIDRLHVGCEELRSAVARVRPRLHVFGHIHEAHGVVEQDGTRFVNACVCDARYRPVQAPVVIDL